VGLWLWVSARSRGLRARVHGGSGGLGAFWRGNARKRGGQKAQKRGFGIILEFFKTILEEKSGKGEHRPQKSVQEILRGSQDEQKYSCL